MSESENKELKSYFFTFGGNHCTEDGFSLGSFYCEILAETMNAARDQMFAARGDRWAFCYPSAEDAGVTQFFLRKVSLDKIKLTDKCTQGLIR